MSIRVLGLAAAVALLISSEASLSASYSCQNSDFQISCKDSACASSAEFTPMSISVDTKHKTLSACVYSGCWEGRATTFDMAGSFIVAASRALKPNAPGLEEASAVLVIETEQRGAVFNGFGFQTPMTCSVKP